MLQEQAQVHSDLLLPRAAVVVVAVVLVEVEEAAVAAAAAQEGCHLKAGTW